MNVELWWAGKRIRRVTRAEKRRRVPRDATLRSAETRTRPRSCGATAPLTRDYLRRRPLRPWLVLAGGRAPYRGSASLAAAGGSSGTSWRLARWLAVARLTAGNTVVRGMLAQLSSADHRGLAYLVGRVSTSATAGRDHDSRTRHCPHTRFTRRRTSIAPSQALRRPVNRIYSENAKKTDTKASILLSGERAEVA